jgi:hypothetical protein
VITSNGSDDIYSVFKNTDDTSTREIGHSNEIFTHRDRVLPHRRVLTRTSTNGEQADRNIETTKLNSDNLTLDCSVVNSRLIQTRNMSQRNSLLSEMMDDRVSCPPGVTIRVASSWRRCSDTNTMHYLIDPDNRQQTALRAITTHRRIKKQVSGISSLVLERG